MWSAMITQFLKTNTNNTVYLYFWQLCVVKPTRFLPGSVQQRTLNSIVPVFTAEPSRPGGWFAVDCFYWTVTFIYSVVLFMNTHKRQISFFFFFLFFKNFQEIKFTSDIDLFANPQFEYCDRQKNSRVAYPEQFAQMSVFFIAYLPTLVICHGTVDKKLLTPPYSTVPLYSILNSPPFLWRCTRLTQTAFLSEYSTS